MDREYIPSKSFSSQESVNTTHVSVGAAVGKFVGIKVVTGALEGVPDGETVGFDIEGATVGSSLGLIDGPAVGISVGSENSGDFVGIGEGISVGELVMTRAAEQTKLHKNRSEAGARSAPAVYQLLTCSNESDSSLAMIS